jgi:hypothetical protein
MNKVSAGVTLAHALREPVDQYAGPIKEPEHLALCQGRKGCLVSPQGAGFTALSRPQNSDCGSPIVGERAAV